jgi:hypothetical protein
VSPPRARAAAIASTLRTFTRDPRL